MSATTERTITVFGHIPKTAGMTVTRMLRSTYGLAHCRALWAHRDGPGAGVDLILGAYPRVRVISGHSMRPWHDYGFHERRFRWFTMLREPNERFFSHYRYWCQQARSPMSFAEWCAENGERLANRQVFWLTGEQDLDEAKRVLVERFEAVGDQADLNTSLRMFAERIDDGRFPTSTTLVENSSAAVETTADRAIGNRYNELDQELYTWFREVVWPKQLSRLRGGPERPFVDDVPSRVRNGVNRAYHGLMYRPLARRTASIPPSRGAALDRVRDRLR